MGQISIASQEAALVQQEATAGVQLKADSIMPTIQHVVLPQNQHMYPQHQQHKDAWHQFEGLVFALIFIHVAAFAFWCYLLYKSKAARSEAAKGRAKSSTGAAAAAATAAGDWKSPKEILKAYQKAQLGKA